MSEQVPYNNEQWGDLPLPDGDVAWQKMEVLLDEEKKRRGLPFWWRYAGLAVLLMGVAAGGWLWLSGSEETKSTSNTTTSTSLQPTVIPSNNQPGQTKKDPSVTDQPIQTNKPILTAPSTTIPSNNETTLVVTKDASNTTKTTVSKRSSYSSKTVPQQIKQRTKRTSSAITKTDVPAIATVTKKSTTDKPEAKQKTPTTQKDNKPFETSSSNKPVEKKDIKTPVDSTAKDDAPPVPDDNSPKQKTKKPAFVWSAGVGLQQAIAVNGQQSSSFNYNGKKGAVTDYFPSVYLRLQKGAWFAQAEFQYGVPQPVSNFAFSQKTKFDAASSSINTERFTIQKLYYHQLPVSINYHVSPTLSFGVGGMYNILAGAVTEQEVQSRNVQTGNQTTTKNLAPVKGFRDSFLYKTTAGILLQTDYHWRRFSLGLRFTQNLQPYIKYTKPDGTVLDEKTNSLQAILRFRLWSGK